MSATPPEVSTEYSRGLRASRTLARVPQGGPTARLQRADPAWSSGLRATVFGATLVAAVLLVVAEFTALSTVTTAASGHAIKARSTGSHDAYALIPVALVALALAYGAALRGSRVALLALGALGVATLLVALIGDLPDARATGVLSGSSTRLVDASATPGAGLYIETVGAIMLIIASGCGVLLGGSLPPQTNFPGGPVGRQRSGS